MTHQPEVVSFLGALTVGLPGPWPGRSETMTYGTDLEVTAEVRRCNEDRHGNSWLDLLGDPDAQVRRWGQQMFRRGPWPDGESRAKPGSEEWWAEREVLRAEAHALRNEGERAERLGLIDAVYGHRVTSKTLRAFASPNDRSSA